jgi:hypothetical protein
VKPIRVKIPHSFYHLPADSSEEIDHEFNICLITKSNEKEMISNYFENQFQLTKELSDYFQNNKLIPINYAKNITVYSINDLKLYFKQYKLKRNLLKNFTHFFVDNEISLYVYNLLGKTFQEHNKYPVVLHYSKRLGNNSTADQAVSTVEKQKELAEGNTVTDNNSVNFDKIVKEINKNIYFSTFLFLHSKNIQFKIGFTHMTPKQLQENILFGLFYLMKFKLGNSWKHIQCIYLRTKDSPALPVYSHVNYELYEFLQLKINEKKSQQQQLTNDTEAKNKNAKKAPASAKKPQQQQPGAEEEEIPVPNDEGNNKKKRKHEETPAKVAREVEEPKSVQSESKQQAKKVKAKK